MSFEPNRRAVLGGLAALAASGCKSTPVPASDPGAPTEPVPTPPPSDEPLPTPTPPPTEIQWNPGTWMPEEPVDDAVFERGCRSGDPEPTEITVGVIVEGASQVTFVVVEESDAGWRIITEQPVDGDQDVFQTRIEGLIPDTLYAWIARVDGVRSPIASFRTAPELPRIVRFGATSCLGGEYPWPTLSQAASQDLDAFLFLGDTVYADWGANEPLENKWIDAVMRTGMRELCETTPVIATWDDHEIWNNWTWSSTTQSEYDEGLRLFRAHLPQKQGPTGGIWRSVRWGDTIEFFVLDCRSERVDGRYISEAQMDWLRNGLEQSTAVFKVIVNSVPATDFSFLPFVGSFAEDERWQGFPADRGPLMDTCDSISGVFFVSGDFHVGGAGRINPDNAPSGHVLEILAGPGGSPISTAYSLVPESARLPRVVAEHNYAEFACAPDSGEVVVTWRSGSGAVLDTFTFNPVV